ncbi:uncharacterized protein [Ptychodera flava]|uniref:uncharacterized protein n=1 Tax=Ptychodera flava TaxID=63121 RepID=UPI003969F737
MLRVGVFLAAALHFASSQDVTVSSFSVNGADSLTYLTSVGTDVTFNITLDNSDSQTAGSVSDIKLYLTNNGEYDSADIKSSAFDTNYGTSPIAVPASATDEPVVDITATLSVDENNCESYTHVCVVLTSEGDNDVTNDDRCLGFGNTAADAGTKHCPQDDSVTISSFSVTDPSTTIYLTGDTSIDLTIGFSNTDQFYAKEITSLDLYLTNSSDYSSDSVRKSAAFAVLDEASLPVTVGAGDSDNDAVQSTAAVTVTDDTQCDEWTHLCVVAEDEADAVIASLCLELDDQEAGALFCPNVDVSVASFSITGPENRQYSSTTPVEITFDLGLSNSDQHYDGSISAVNIRLTNGDTGSATVESDPIATTVQTPLTVAKGSDNFEQTAKTANVIASDVTECTDYTHLCVVVTPDPADDASNDYHCVSLGPENEAGTVTCPVEISLESYSITEPAIEGRVYKVSEPTTITLQVTLGNTVDEQSGSVAAIDLYFTNNADYIAASEKSTAISTSLPSGENFPIDVQSTSLEKTGLEASVTLGGAIEKCALYTHQCVVITPSPVDDLSNDYKCIPLGEGENKAGILRCPAVELTVKNVQVTSPASSVIMSGENAKVIFNVTVETTDTSHNISGDDNWNIECFLATDTSGSDEKGKAPAETTSMTELRGFDLNAGDEVTFADVQVRLALGQEKCGESSYFCVTVSPSTDANWFVTKSNVTDATNDNLDCVEVECTDSSIVVGGSSLFASSLLAYLVIILAVDT